MATKRLFFALWPTVEITQSIKQNTDQIKKSISGKFVASSNWHITLAFLGNIDSKTRACLIEQANKIKCTPFSIKFNNILYFKNPKILCYGLNKNTDTKDLNLLVQACKEIQNKCGLQSETRQFLPHITIVRKVKKPQTEIKINPTSWQANEFVLVSSELSEKGSVYTVLNRWTLTPK